MDIEDEELLACDMLNYTREFTLQSCHYNDAVTYNKYTEALRLRDSEADYGGALALLLEVLPDIHGHNFRVQVSGSRPVEVNDDCIVVWDEDLDKLVNEWNRCNLSVHPDLEGKRATTEVLAMVLKEKLDKHFPDVAWSVTIWETDEISASVG